MSDVYAFKNSACIAVILTMLPFASSAMAANDFTAKTVMEKMKAEDRYPYISGVVEGIAYARYKRDGKKLEGMDCIYGWFYDHYPDTLNLIYAAFGKYPDFTPGAIIGALADKNCGG